MKTANSFFKSPSAKKRTWLVAILVTLSTCVVARAEVRFRKVGNPLWEPTGAFIASLESFQDPDISFVENHRIQIADLLGPSHVLQENAEFGFFPTQPHSGDHGRDFQEAIAAGGGIDADVVPVLDVREPREIIRGITFVPTDEAPTGRSFHADNEAVIPNDIFPITANYVQESYNGNAVIDGNNEGCICEIEIQALHDYGVITDTDGMERDYTGLNWSHIHMPFGAFWPSDRSLDHIVGNYRGIFRYRDQENNGWNITFSYEAKHPTDIAGDLDFDGSLDVDDLDTLVHNVALGSTHLRLDMNEDEVVNVDDVHFWVTHLNNSWVGDADLDGEFNSGDLVDVFTAGKYETNEMAIWSEGDWNADERFDSTDFVVAFQGGGYEMGIRRPVATVPEPSSWILVILGLGVIARLRR